MNPKAGVDQTQDRFAAILDAVPVIAILRGVAPAEAVDIGLAVAAAGIRAIEVPLNSPSAVDSIRALAKHLPADCLVGGGTVLDPAAVEEIAAAGGRLIVAPNTDHRVIRRALLENLIVMPGVATATEVFDAYHAGARRLKLFPAATYGPGHLRSLHAVIPADCRLYAVGGISIGGMEKWLDAGAAGFGFGSELYRPGDSPEQVGGKATNIATELQPLLRKYNDGR